MTLVKICGITNLEDAQIAIEHGADAIGFNFYPGSKRFVDEGYVKSIVDQLENPITKVGVFVNQSIEEICEAKSIAEFDVIQLHGDESPSFVNDLRRKTETTIIKVFRVSDEFDFQVVSHCNVDAILLDSFSADEYGGTGYAFDWTIAAKIAKEFPNVYLAGGLTSENVAEAIRQVRPYAVDVASGVEVRPGIKDPARVAAFIKAAKEAI